MPISKQSGPNYKLCRDTAVCNPGWPTLQSRIMNIVLCKEESNAF